MANDVRDLAISGQVPVRSRPLFWLQTNFRGDTGKGACISEAIAVQSPSRPVQFGALSFCH
jgi:hypothetical protein